MHVQRKRRQAAQRQRAGAHEVLDVLGHQRSFMGALSEPTLTHEREHLLRGLATVAVGVFHFDG